jgi:predicted transcriptional regulator
MPALTDDQWKLLNALMAEQGPKTEAELQSRTGLEEVVVVTALNELAAFDPPLVAHESDRTLPPGVWIGTTAAGDLLDER